MELNLKSYSYLNHLSKFVNLGQSHFSQLQDGNNTYFTILPLDIYVKHVAKCLDDDSNDNGDQIVLDLFLSSSLFPLSLVFCTPDPYSSKYSMAPLDSGFLHMVFLQSGIPFAHLFGDIY